MKEEFGGLNEGEADAVGEENTGTSHITTPDVHIPKHWRNLRVRVRSESLCPALLRGNARISYVEMEKKPCMKTRNTISAKIYSLHFYVSASNLHTLPTNREVLDTLIRLHFRS